MDISVVFVGYAMSLTLSPFFDIVISPPLRELVRITSLIKLAMSPLSKYEINPHYQSSAQMPK